MGHEDSFPGYRYSNLKGTTRMQCFQIDTYVYSCFRIGTSRVLPGCSSPCGFAALLGILTLPELDHEAAMLKKKSLFSSLLNHDIATWHFRFSMQNNCIRKRETHILLYSHLFFQQYVKYCSFVLIIFGIYSFISIHSEGTQTFKLRGRLLDGCV